VKPLFEFALSVMDRALQYLADQVPPPAPIALGDGFVYRYTEKTIEQAIVLKLVAIISRLRASSVLLAAGYVNEQAVVHRLIDELNEDVMFLVLSRSSEGVTSLHERFLRSFFAEEFKDPANIVGTRLARDIVPRRKIRAYIARSGNATEDPHGELEIAETIGKLYSGFVHGAAPFILELYAGDPPRFHLTGMLNTPRIDEHLSDSWNYHYRSLLSFHAAAKTFGHEGLCRYMTASIGEFERRSGPSFSRESRKIGI
jgi:hypothetical protein